MTIQDHRQWLLKKEESLKRGQVDPERLKRKTADGFFFWLANRIFVPLTSWFCLGYNKWGGKKQSKEGNQSRYVCGCVAEGQAGVGETGRSGNRWSVIVSPGRERPEWEADDQFVSQLSVMWTTRWLKSWVLYFVPATTRLSEATVLCLHRPFHQFKKGQASVLVGRF